MSKRSKFKILSILRSWGFLCKKTYAKSKRLHIKHTIMPTGEIIVHNSPIFIADLPINKTSFDSEMHVWLEWKKSFDAKCSFGTPKHTDVTVNQSSL